MAQNVEPAAPAVQPAVATPRRFRLKPGQLLTYVVLIILAVLFIAPLVWMISTSLKAGAAVFTDTGWIPENPSFENFETIFGSDFPVISWFITSLMTSLIGTVLVVILTSMSGYAFARMDFPGKRILFGLLIATLLLPSVMFLVPQFLIILQIGNVVPELGLATIPAYMLPHLAAVFGVFFMRQFFQGIPVEIEEAAYVDGASRFKTFRSVVLPLAGPALATLGVITFLAIWNDYLWPLVNCTFDSDACTLQAGLVNFQGQYSAEYGLLMAGTVVAAVPVLIFYVLAQRFVIQSVASAGVKG
ncbi:MAG: multiple sugar transport system permease protein [Chloroflexota bacterium]|jgi:multiple sugar transport system permease protein|nr:multiple sugar transport system permease protein [Chloroflexota bacterium]